MYFTYYWVLYYKNVDIAVMHMLLNYLVIEAQIPMLEELRNKTSIQFPAITNKSTDVSLVFGNMTPMIEIPSSIVLKQLEEGIH